MMRFPKNKPRKGRAPITRAESGAGSRADFRLVRDGRPRVRFAADLAKELSAKGYGYVKGEEVVVAPRLKESLAEFLKECGDLPPDSYCANGTRRRRHSRFLLLPWAGRLVAWPARGYFQDASVNKDDGGATRHFAPLTRAMQANEFLLDLILDDFRLVPFAERDRLQPMDVGVHVIELNPRRGAEATATPNCLHKDGEPYTFVHLLKREGVSGGESVVADNDKNLLFIATLSDPFDTLVVRDESVYHHVMPVKLAPLSTKGSRVALLVDFTPMRPATQLYGQAA
jgi:hypothetical protein